MDLLLFFLSIGCIWLILYVLSRKIWIRMKNPEIGLGYALFRIRGLNNLLYRLGNVRIIRVLAPAFFDIGVLSSISFLVLALVLLSINSVFFFIKEESAVEMTPVIPGITVSFQSLPYLLIALLIAAAFHELAHAIAAITENKTVKSTGIFILAILLAFFVELDDKELLNISPRSKLRIFSAGVLSNLILTLVFLTLLSTPVYQTISAPFYDTEPSGALILYIAPDSPANLAGIQEGWTIQKLEIFERDFGSLSNTTIIKNQLDLSRVLTNITANQNITITFLQGEVNITTTQHPSMPVESNHGFIGISYWDYYAPSNFGGIYLPPVLKYHVTLILVWSLMINFGLAVFNLLPIPLLDGDKILSAIVNSRINDEKKAQILIKYIRVAALILFLANVVLTVAIKGINPI